MSKARRNPKSRSQHRKKPSPRSSARVRAKSPRATAIAVAAAAKAGHRKVAGPMSAVKTLAVRKTGSSRKASALKIPDAVTAVAGVNAVAVVVIETGSVADQKLWRKQVTTVSSRSVRIPPTTATSRVSVPVI